MLYLRAAVLHLASELPKGNPTRRRLLEALVAKGKENPAQKAIWNAWDWMSGTESVREYDSFDGAVGSFALDIETGPDEMMDSFFDKAAKGIQRKLRSLDRQSRSWRAAYNMWLEGKTIDVTRLQRDMLTSLKTIEAIQSTLTQMGKLEKEFPAVWADLDHDYKRAVSSASATVSAFKNATKTLDGWT